MSTIHITDRTEPSRTLAEIGVYFLTIEKETEGLPDGLLVLKAET